MIGITDNMNIEDKIHEAKKSFIKQHRCHPTKVHFTLEDEVDLESAYHVSLNQGEKSPDRSRVESIMKERFNLEVVWDAEEFAVT